jgi:mono/diheme cytochrome c family protein
MTHKRIITFVIIGLGGFSLANAQTKIDVSRGELLYSTHCITCHSTQMHWRDKKVATNWSILKAEVRQWQSTSGLGWSEEDVTAVARYLNVQFYHFPVPEIASSPTKDNAKLTSQPY